MVETILILVLMSLAMPSSGHAAAPPNRVSVADAVVASPDLRYQTSFVVDCSEATWRKVLDNPWLMGQLWSVYGYAPAYKVRATADGVHVDDPTGLAGEFWLVRKDTHEHRYLGAGRISHRAVPFFNSGHVVTIVRSETVGRQVRATMQVYIRADRAISRAALWAGKPLLLGRVENRVHVNVQDGIRLVEQVASSPETVLRQLQGPAAETFRAEFVPRKVPPAPPTRRSQAPRPGPRR
jgi:hypothetical protein